MFVKFCMGIEYLEERFEKITCILVGIRYICFEVQFSQDGFVNERLWKSALNPCKSMLKYLVICKKFHPQRKGNISCQTEASLRAFFASRHSPCPMVSCNCPKTNSTCWTIDIFMCFRCFSMTLLRHIFSETSWVVRVVWPRLGFVDMGSLLHNSAWIGIALTLFCVLPWLKKNRNLIHLIRGS